MVVGGFDTFGDGKNCEVVYSCCRLCTSSSAASRFLVLADSLFPSFRSRMHLFFSLFFLSSVLCVDMYEQRVPGMNTVSVRSFLLSSSTTGSGGGPSQRRNGQAVVTGVLTYPPPWFLACFLSHVGMHIPTSRRFG